ncbi:MAG TPA: ABC transporter permease [Bryobacteraceae bacterium]|nr:ABC transporter permease [Bryobacteraceae bacterium]
MTNWLKALFRPPRDQEIHDEIQSHLDMRTEWNRSAGLPSGRAQLDARRRFGNPTLIAEETSAIHRASWSTAARQDVRYGLRAFRRAPVFTLTAIVTVALGIGASTAVFSVVDRILFRALPYPDSDRLVSVGMLAPYADNNEFLMVPSYRRLQDQQTPFLSMAAFGFSSPCDLTESNPVRLSCALVDAAFLPTFGIRPMAGRNFTAAEDVPNAPAVALLTYGFWMRRFAGDSGIVGRAILIDDKSVTVVGILPRDFELFNLSQVDLLMPVALLPDQSTRVVRAFARLKPGVSIAQAQSALQPLFAEETPHIPKEYLPGMSLVVRPLRDRQIANVRTASWTLLVAVGTVLLMACANVANLLLARSASRRRELAVRHALGAGRARLIRQTLTESLLLAVAGATAGCGLAWGLLRFFVAIAPNGITRLDQASLDVRVLLFTAAVSILAGLAFGMAPALERPDAEALSGGRSIAGFRGALRHGLVSLQIAASLLLLSGASLLVRALWRMEHVPLGIQPDHALSARFVLSKSYRQARVLAFYEGLEARLNRLPGAIAAISDTIPPGGSMSTPFSAIAVEGRPWLPEGVGGGVSWRYITPGYFGALGIPILRGRTFNEEDRSANASAIIINQTLAQRLFPGQDPLGRHILRSAKGEWHTVVGVCGDIRNRGLSRPPEPEYYVARKHVPDEIFGDGSRVLGGIVTVRSPFDAQAVAAALRADFTELDPTLPVEIETIQARFQKLTDGPRFDAMLLAGFAATGLVLAAIGIYSVIAFLVMQRTREVGIRMALGATPASVVGLFLRHAAPWTAAGLCMGILGSIFASRLLSSLLFEAQGRDWPSFVIAAATLCAVALCAACLPARRAAQIDPVKTLRQD